MKKDELTLAEKINQGKLSDKEIDEVVNKLYVHLQNPWGTLENFPRKATIDLIAKHYPDKIDLDELKETTETKVNSYMSNIADKIYNNERVVNDTKLINMLINNFLRGKEEESKGNVGVAFQVNFQVEESGKVVMPEQKRENINEIFQQPIKNEECEEL